MSLIKNTLGQSSFWMVNKAVAKVVGVEAALLLSELIDRDSYIKDRQHYNGEEYFYATTDSLEEATALTYRVQVTCINKLKKAGLIATRRMGLPAKQHFTIRENTICEIVKSSSAENARLLYKENKNRENKNRDQKGEAPPRGPHLFKNSIIAEEQAFKEKFQEAAEAGVEIMYYYQRVKNWSASKSAMRVDWVATTKNIMAEDKVRGKLVMRSANSRLKSEDSIMAFINS